MEQLSNCWRKGVLHFIRVGTLDNPDLLPPDVHIYTESKQPWVTLPPEALAAEQFYDQAQTWTEANIKIFNSLRDKAKELSE